MMWGMGWVALIVFLFFVLPIWIIVHYATRWRTSKTLSLEDEKLLSELWKTSETLEDRIGTIERILDADVPGWRERP